MIKISINIIHLSKNIVLIITKKKKRGAQNIELATSLYFLLLYGLKKKEIYQYLFHPNHLFLVL